MSPPHGSMIRHMKRWSFSGTSFPLNRSDSVDFDPRSAVGVVVGDPATLTCGAFQIATHGTLILLGTGALDRSERPASATRTVAPLTPVTPRMFVAFLNDSRRK